MDGLSQTLGLLGDHPQSEDCLTLNVFAPAAPAPPRPVLVWLHGGAFQTGTAAGPAYDGARLARRGDVVVVTLNYRVGALGFLHTGAARLREPRPPGPARRAALRAGGDRRASAATRRG